MAADAEVWLIRGEGGAVTPMVPPFGEGIAARLASGALIRVNPDGSPWTGPAAAPAPAPAAPAPEPEKPAPASLAEKNAAEQLAEQATPTPLPKPDRSDRKAAWVAYAASTQKITLDAANELTVRELIERFGGE